jgi:hypothetical protein
MFTYFIPLTVNLTKNSKLEKFVHELNALWMLSGSSMGALRELVAVVGIDCINTNCIITDCINANFNTCKLHVHRIYDTNLYCSNSHDMNLYRVADGHVKLNILDDRQECLNNSHHRIALEYDEDTLSLVVDPTLSTLDISVPDNSDSSTGNASAFEYECYEVEDDTPQFIYHGPKIKNPKQELPVTICTADTIGSIRSQRLF